MSEDILIDGTTGEIIGPIPRSAKHAKPTFTGATEPDITLVPTKVIRRYRGFREDAPITIRNPPPGPSADQFAEFLRESEKVLRKLNRRVTHQNPLLGIIGEVMLNALKEKGRKPRR